MERERSYKKGLETMQRFLGDVVVADFSDAEKNPLWEWDKETISFAFGEVYARPNLDAKSRTLCAIAALTVLGDWEILEKWLIGARLAGIAEQEILEVIYQVAIYGGFPNSRKALLMAKESFKKGNI